MIAGGVPLGDLEKLVADFRQSGLRELHARCGDFEVYLSQDPTAPGLDGPNVAVGTVQQQAVQPVAPAQPSAPAAPAGSPAASDRVFAADALVVRAPYLGTFYRAPKPGAPAYVEIGSTVTAESEMCLVEVMKLFTAVRAEAAGRVSEILASDGDLVEAGQPLFVLTAV